MLIYDHYLIVREWAPNFQPQSVSIERVAVWVRFLGLPIEYHDSKFLKCLGNRIGRTVRVDKNTLSQERGKYARKCVEVDLNKPLLPMFEVDGKAYTIEYEGLHLLCLTCGKFGHYKEGCPNKVAASTSHNSGSRIGGDAGSETGATRGERRDIAGPWTVVQKPRRQRKGPSVEV